MELFRNIKVSHKISLGYVSVLSLMLIVSIVVYFSITSIISSSKWVNHTYEVIRTAEQVSAALVDMETGQRGFMVTGEDEYLEPYFDGLSSFDSLIKKGLELTSDNPNQDARWKAVKEIKSTLMSAVAGPEIQARREVAKGAEAVAKFKEISSRTVGKTIFDSIRAVLGSLQSSFEAENNVRAAYLITEITLDLVNMETGQRGFLLTGLDESLEPFNAGSKNLEANVVRLRSLISGSNVVAADLQDLQAKVNNWKAQAAEPEINARREMNRYPITIEDVADMMSQGQGKILMDSARAKIKEIVDEEEKLIIVRANQQESSSTFGISVTIIGTLLAIILGSAAGYVVIRGIMEPINAMNDILKEIAEGNGDLTKRVRVISQDEVGEMGEYFNRFISKLQNIIQQVIESSTKVSEAAEQMLKVTARTSDGVNKQSNETLQLASAMTQMVNTVDEIAKHSQLANDEARNADSKAQSGNQVVAKTVATINELSADVEASSHILEKLKGDSENISTVLDVIKNIADQTNLLALNAAIEAARAGEQGRGFAVVADEVRTLAKRTQDSTAEIENLISALQQGADSAVNAMEQNSVKTTSTVEQIDEAGKILQAITHGVSNIVNMNSQIAVATEEQSGVAKEINRNVESIQNVSEQTASDASLSSKSSEQLVLLGNQLRQLVDQFKV